MKTINSSLNAYISRRLNELYSNSNNQDRFIPGDPWEDKDIKKANPNQNQPKLIQDPVGTTQKITGVLSPLHLWGAWMRDENKRYNGMVVDFFDTIGSRIVLKVFIDFATKQVFVLKSLNAEFGQSGAAASLQPHYDGLKDFGAALKTSYIEHLTRRNKLDVLKRPEYSNAPVLGKIDPSAVQEAKRMFAQSRSNPEKHTQGGLYSDTVPSVNDLNHTSDKARYYSD